MVSLNVHGNSTAVLVCNNTLGIAFAYVFLELGVIDLTVACIFQLPTATDKQISQYGGDYYIYPSEIERGLSALVFLVLLFVCH